MKLSPILGSGALILLTACGGGSGGDDTPDVVTLDQLAARLTAFEAAFGTATINSNELISQFTLDANIPDTGSVRYTGIAIITTPSGENTNQDMVAGGSSTMTANFSDSTITGTADNFYLTEESEVDDPIGSPIAGSLTYNLTGAPGQNDYEGRFIGTLSPVGQETLNINILGAGAFVGQNLEGFAARALDENDETKGEVGLLMLKD